MRWHIDESTGDLVILQEDNDADLMQELFEIAEVDAILRIAEEFDGELEFVSPEDIGALTDGPIFYDPATDRYYWFSDYMLGSLIGPLVRTGETRIPEAPDG